MEPEDLQSVFTSLNNVLPPLPHTMQIQKSLFERMKEQSNTAKLEYTASGIKVYSSELYPYTTDSGIKIVGYIFSHDGQPLHFIKHYEWPASPSK
jgi:hypothetical protein